MRYFLLAVALVVETVTAYPFVAGLPGVDSSLFRKRQQSGGLNGGTATCPFNPNHVPAAPVTAQYPYNGAVNGLPGKGKGGYQVPAPGDTAHQFVAPGPNDIRECPFCPSTESLQLHLTSKKVVLVRVSIQLPIITSLLMMVLLPSMNLSMPNKTFITLAMTWL